MEAFLLKLVATPILAGGASLAGRRWGAEVGGWLLGIPFTSGPIVFFLALTPGPHFAAQAAIGVLAGTASQAAFALAYARVAVLGGGWAPSIVAASAAFLAVTAALNALRPELLPAFALAIAAAVIAIVLMPRARDASAAAPPLPWWDIPARMVVATAFVIALTEAAPALGSRLAGLLSPFPVYATVLSVFAHRLTGPASAVAVLRGLLAGLFGFALFFVTVALTLESRGIAFAFAVGLVIALAAQGVSLAIAHRYRFHR